jgi:hypothetical protein
LPDLHIEAITKVLGLPSGISIALRFQVGEREDMAVIIQDVRAVIGGFWPEQIASFGIACLRPKNVFGGGSSLATASKARSRQLVIDQ